MDQCMRIEAWAIVEEILDSILNEIVLAEGLPSSEDNNASSSGAVEETQEENVSVSVKDRDLPPLSDEARDEDKMIRLTVLQKLLELACAMVTYDHCKAAPILDFTDTLSTVIKCLTCTTTNTDTWKYYRLCDHY